METQSNHFRHGATAVAAVTLKQRRRFSCCVGRLGSPLIAAATPLRARNSTNRLHLQDGRIAGGHYYGCHKLLAHLHVGHARQLHRQPGDPHDERAIEVFWRGRKLDYLPRLGNAAAASLGDRTRALRAEIIGIDDPDEEWEPMKLRVWVIPA